MHKNRLLAAAVVTLGMCLPANATEPAAPKLDLQSAEIIQVDRDCHRDSRRHYLDDYGRRIWHHHSGRHCRVVLDEEDDDEEDYDYRHYPPSSHSGCFIAGSPPLTFEICP